MKTLTNLVPYFILEKQQTNELSGQFSAVTLFADVSGFSTVTNTLVAHGSEAAEVMADIMLAIFEPMVDNIYAHNGFITTFAGDAFTALFPNPKDETSAYVHALAAAHTIQQSLESNPIHKTEYGDFSFDVKLGLAVGEVEWGILSPTDEQVAKSAYYFRGSAIDGAAESEHYAQSGDIVLSPEVHKVLNDVIESTSVSETHMRVEKVVGDLVSAQSLGTPELYRGQDRFIPQAILEKESRGEFRQVVSVFINLKGIHTSEDLANFVGTIFNLQTDYGGLLARVDFGDKGANLLLFWGMPTSYENDVDDALSFIHHLREIAPSKFKAGITNRFMYAGLAGSARRGEYTAYGGGVSYAARLMVKAPWGAVWLDERVVDHASKRYVCQKEGLYGFKGFVKTQAVYSLVGQQEVSLTDFYDSEMIGRQAELAQLEAFIAPLVDAEQEKRFAGVLVVKGEAGLGKSRLVTEFLISPKNKSFQYFIAQTDQTVRSSFNPFRYWLRNYFEQSSVNDAEQNKQYFEQKLDQLIIYLESNTSSQVKKLSEDLTYGRSFLGALISLYWENSPYENLDGAGRYEWTLSSLKSLLLAESLRKPVVFNFEDAHWLDGESIAMMERLVRQIDGYPLAIIATTRPIPKDKTLLGNINFETIDLELMIAKDLKLLAENILGASIYEALATLLYQRAEGNPFFAEQIVRYLKEKGVIKEQDNQWILVGETPAATLPTDVRSIFAARLDQLTQDVKSVVQTAAILGREFEVQLLTQMLQEKDALPDKIATAEQEAIWSKLSQIRYLFKHGLLRDAAYDMQLRSQRRELHLTAARALETLYEASNNKNEYVDNIALQYENAYKQGLIKAQKPATTWLKQAAEKAAKNYENNSAIDFFTRALAVVSQKELTNQHELLLGREMVYGLVGKQDAQAKDLEALVAINDILQKPTQLIDTLLEQSKLAAITHDFSSAQNFAEQAVNLAKTAEDLGREAKAQRALGESFLKADIYNLAQEHLATAIKLAQNAKQQDIEVDAVRLLGTIALFHNDYKKAQQLYSESLEGYLALGDLEGKAIALSNLAEIFMDQGDFEKARQFLDQSLSNAREAGAYRNEIRILINHGTLHYWLAEYDEAIWCYKECLTMYIEFSNPVGKMEALNNIGEIYVVLGHDEYAQHYLFECLGLAKELGTKRDEAFMQCGLGLADINQGRYNDAQLKFEESILYLDEVENLYCRGFSLTGLGETKGFLGNIAEATNHLLDAIRLRQEAGTDVLAVESQAILADLYLRQGNLTKAQETLADVQAYWTSKGDFEGAKSSKILLVCHKVLKAVNDPQAVYFLQQAYDELQEQVNKLSDVTLRQTYLENVPWNREIVIAFEEKP